MRKLKPILAGDWWLIGRNPDLPGLPGDAARRADWEAKAREPEYNASVDHHLFQGPDGAFHLWGCIRGTAVGRILYRWETDDISRSPWRETGEYIRIDRSAGESIHDYGGQEWIQSPYFVEHNGTYYMLYGGHSSGTTQAGEAVPAGGEDGLRIPKLACQMCLMTSTDGRKWTRHKDEQGRSRLFLGPGEVRDPCVIRVGDQWLCYYAGFLGEDQKQCGFFVRTSKDLLHWSDSRVVLREPAPAAGPWSWECPHVVFREGYYYLFRTENYYEKKTHVYRSTDPFDFGDRGMLSAKNFVGMFPAAAVEIYTIGGKEYVTSSHNPKVGEFMAELRWEEQR